DTDEIATGAVTEVKIEDGAVTADKITVNELSAISADLGAITAGTLQNSGSDAIPSNIFTRSSNRNIPTGDESGTFIDLSSGNFVFGNANTFLSFANNTNVTPNVFELDVKGVLSPTILDLSAVTDVTVMPETIKAQGYVPSSIPPTALSDEVWNQIDGLIGQAGTGFYVSASGVYLGEAQKIINLGSTPDHRSGDITVQVVVADSFSADVDFSAGSDPLKLNITLQYKLASASDYSNAVTISTTSGGAAGAAQKPANPKQVLSGTVYSINESITVTLTSGEGQDIADNVDLDFRVILERVGSQSAFATVANGGANDTDGTPVTLQVSEGAAGIVATAGNAETLDNIDSTGFLRLGTSSATVDNNAFGNQTFTGDVTVTGTLNLQGSIDQYNVTDLEVVDKTISLNSGNTQSLSNGAGIKIDRGSATDASILWDESNDEFDFSHSINLGGKSLSEVQQVLGTEGSGWLEFNEDDDNVWPTGTRDNITVLGSVTDTVFAADSNANGTGGIFYFGHGQAKDGGGTFTQTASLDRDGDLKIAGQLQHDSNLTLNVAGSINLDADNSGNVFLKDDNVSYGRLHKSGDHFVIKNVINDGDIRFQGKDTSGTELTALTLDMSNSGAATFNGAISSGAITSTGTSTGRYTGLEIVNTTNAAGTETAIGLGVVSANNANCDVKLVAHRVGFNFGSDFYIEQTDNSGNQQETFRVSESGAVSFTGTLSSGKITTSVGMIVTDISSIGRGIYRNNTGYDLRVGGGTDSTDGAFISLSGETRGGAANVNNGKIEYITGGTGFTNQAAVLGDHRFMARHAGGTATMMVLDSSTGDLDLKQGDYQINGQTVIDASRNLSNIAKAEINASGTDTVGSIRLHVGALNHIGSSAIAQFGGFIRAAQVIFLHASAGSSNALKIDYVSDDMDITSGEGTYTGGLRANAYKIGSTSVIDSSRNLLNIGTISATGPVTIALNASRQLKVDFDTEGDSRTSLRSVEGTASNLRPIQIEGQEIVLSTAAFNQTASVERVRISDTGGVVFSGGFSTGSGVTIGGGLTSSTITVNSTDSTNEGGEILLKGAGTNLDLRIDNFAGGFRVFDSASTPLVRLRLDTSGNAIIAGRVTAGDGTTVKAAYGFDSSATTGISYSSTNNRVNILSGGAVKAYVQTGSSNPEVETMYVDGIIQANGKVTWTGGSSTLANTAYTYSQVGHLPLAGGSLTGSLGINCSPSAPLEVSATGMTGVDIAHFSNSNDVVKAKFSLTSNGSGKLDLIEGNNATTISLDSTNGSFTATGAATIGSNLTVNNGELSVTRTGDNFPTFEMARTGGSSKTNQQWDQQIGSTGHWNLKAVTGTVYYPIICTPIGDVNLASNTSGTSPVVSIDQSLARTTFAGTVRVNHSENNGVLVTASDTNADQSFNAMKIDFNVSGSQTTTADRSHIGLHIDADSSATGGDTSDEHRLYGIYNDTRITG
ncbi:MAG: hypothetical protein CML17_10225, partial [Pusillimonas sp.]|nr:hypothetical protein [Pusillimonas sp.]